ncbi:MAG: hypothetical protein VB055_07700 [Oscillospiraceae bacterium]|nr:hypothetical protein [Oscillospiraceae bacterium]
MELVFRENPAGCLRELAVDVIYQEETTELIVPDSYEDVQTIVDSCAVCCMRDKEVLNGSLTVSGAFQASILYTSEETEEPRLLTAYLPFAAKLAREEIQPGATGVTELRLRSVDARILNSRKIMVRVSYAVRLTAYGAGSVTTWDTDGGEQVQLLRQTEKGTFPVAAGEKSMTFSENVELPAVGKEIRRVLKAIPEPMLTERRIVDNKAVLKGAVLLHTVYLLDNGQLSTFDVQLPMSQYLEFDGDISDAEPRASVMLTDFQMEQAEDGSYLVTVGLQLQVVAWKQLELPVIADGYCVGRGFQAAYGEFPIQQALDSPSQVRTAEEKLRGKVRKLVDCTAWVDFPVCRRGEDEITVAAPLTMHALYYDDAGALCGETVKCEESGTFALASGAVCFADADAAGSGYASMAGEETALCCGVSLTARCFGVKTARCMKSAVLGDPLPEAADRPSLIVRRTDGSDSLWNIAKQCGTTMTAIRTANDLTGEAVEENLLLLIPMV